MHNGKADRLSESAYNWLYHDQLQPVDYNRSFFDELKNYEPQF